MADMSQEASAPFTQANEPLEDGHAVYEVGFHVVPTVEETSVAAVVERIRKMLEKAGATVISEHAPKRITFSYRIERSVQGRREKYTEGYFGTIKFEAPSENIKALDAALREDSDILRFITIHTTREDVAPVAPRATYTSDRLEGQTIEKPVAAPEVKAEVSEEELNKSLDALVS